MVVPVDPDNVAALSDRIREGNYDSVAICLLHAYANPEHERAVLSALADGFAGFITASHQVVPEFREYERTSTTVANAYVGPIMQRYLGQLADRLPDAPIRIMQSNGGSISLQAAQRAAIQTVLSGPAGGVVGGAEIGRLAGFPNSITFDMGGTSTDVSLCQGEPGRTAESSVGGLPIRLPVIDIHTVGAGGGSIAYRDPGGALKVGPRSAGAQPGPICYGHGGNRGHGNRRQPVPGPAGPGSLPGGWAATCPGASGGGDGAPGHGAWHGTYRARGGRCPRRQHHHGRGDSCDLG